MKCPPAKTEELVKAWHALMRAARSEHGFLLCGLCVEVNEPNTICYEERWQSFASLETQFRSERYTRLLTLLESATERPSVEFHFVSETRGLECIAAARGEDQTV